MKKKPKPKPSTTGPNGRDAAGKFLPGNKAATGNPHARKVAQLRSAILQAVKPADGEAVIQAILTIAKTGDVPAAKVFFERTLGPPVAADIIERLERLEQLQKENE